MPNTIVYSRLGGAVVSTRIPEDWLKRLQALAERRGLKTSQLLRLLIAQALEIGG